MYEIRALVGTENNALDMIIRKIGCLSMVLPRSDVDWSEVSGISDIWNV